MTRYRMVGSQDPVHRIDRVVDGAKTLELNGDPVSLTDAQYERISPFVRLEPVESDQQASEEEQQAPPAATGRPLKSDKES